MKHLKKGIWMHLEQKHQPIPLPPWKLTWLCGTSPFSMEHIGSFMVDVPACHVSFRGNTVPSLAIQSPCENGFKKPKYHFDFRWLDIPIHYLRIRPDAQQKNMTTSNIHPPQISGEKGLNLQLIPIFCTVSFRKGRLTKESPGGSSHPGTRNHRNTLVQRSQKAKERLALAGSSDLGVTVESDNRENVSRKNTV